MSFELRDMGFMGDRRQEGGTYKRRRHATLVRQSYQSYVIDIVIGHESRYSIKCRVSKMTPMVPLIQMVTCQGIKFTIEREPLLPSAGAKHSLLVVLTLPSPM